MTIHSASTRRPLAVTAFGALLTIIALALFLPGTYLLTLGGSWFYAIQGLALLPISYLVLRQKAKAGSLYALLLFVTIAWAIWESGFDGWAILPRVWLIALLGLGFLFPSIRHSRKPLNSRSTPVPVFVLCLVGAVLVGIGAHALGPNDPLDPRFQAGTQNDIPEEFKDVAAGDGHDWKSWGNDPGGNRFSPLTQINTSNISKLKPAWTVHLGKSVDGEYGALEVTPLKIGNSLYVCTGYNDVLSINAENGHVNWRFKSGIELKKMPYTACRGVAYYEVPQATGVCAKRVIAATMDARLIAMDAATGEMCPSFGENGTVNLLEGLTKADHGTYLVTSAPTVVRGKVVLGGYVADNQYWGEPSGVVRAFDAVTGKLAWAFDVGQPERRGAPAPGEYYTPSTPNSWAPMSADESLGMVFLPTGNATPDYYGAQRRPFDDKFSASVVALNAETGELKWSFQTSHHDLWDYDVASQPTLITLHQNGEEIPALIQPTKRGEIFVLDRRTGKPLSQVTERPVPTKGSAPGERVSPTQPFSDGMPSFSGPDLRERDMWGVTPFDQMWCRVKFQEARYEGTMTPPGLTPNISYPGYLGGMNWGSVSIDRDRNLMIVTSSRLPNYGVLIPRKKADEMGVVPGKGGDLGLYAQAGTPYAIDVTVFLSPLGAPCNEPPYGHITAVDLNTKKLVWSHTLGTARDSGPLGMKSYLPIPMGAPISGGSLVTRGGLIFVAASQEQTFRALDVKTGKELWSSRLAAGGHSVPMTYWSDESQRQFVVLAAGGNVELYSGMNDTIEGYALPKDEVSNTSK